MRAVSREAGQPRRRPGRAGIPEKGTSRPAGMKLPPRSADASRLTGEVRRAMSTGTLQSLLAGFDPELPLDRAKTIPNTWYTDPRVYDAGAATRCSAGRGRRSAGAEQVARAGRVPHRRRSPASRSSSSAATTAMLRAFFNVCRHRAAPILNEPCGTATKLRCRYHGWTYDLAGPAPRDAGVRRRVRLPQGGQRPRPGRRGRRVGAVRVGPSRRAARTRGGVPAIRYPAGWSPRTAFDGLAWFAGRKSYDAGVQLEGVRR